MPYATLDGLTLQIEIGSGGAEESEAMVGDEAEAIDGTFLTSRRDYKRRWELETKLLLKADFDAHIVKLRTTTPISLDGDIVDNVAVDVMPQVATLRRTRVALGEAGIVRFRLREV